MNIDALTPRQRKIILLISDGFSSKEIAKTLNISSRTVGEYRQRLRRKLSIVHQIQWREVAEKIRSKY